MVITVQHTNQKPRYKRTEVGMIPEDWDVKKLGDIAKIYRGASPRPIEDPKWFNEYSNIGWVRISDVTKSVKYLFNTTQHLSEQGVKQSRFVKQENLIMSICATVGKPIITKKDVCIHDGFVIFERPKINIEYLYYFLSSIEDNWSKNGQTGSQMNLNTTIIENEYISFPNSLEEQRAIATALSDVDALIASLDKLIAKKRDIKQATMQQLLTGKTRLPGFSGELRPTLNMTKMGVIPTEWNPYKFVQIATVRREKVNPKRFSKYTFCVELEHIGQGLGRLISHSTITAESSLKAQFNTGDVLFGRLRAYLRKYWLADRDGVCSTEIWPLASNSDVITKQYLFQLVQTNQFIEAASSSYGTHMPRTDWGVIKNYEVSLPSLNEQQAIANILSDMDTEIAALEQRRDKTRALKQGMMQELLTGKTRLL